MASAEKYDILQEMLKVITEARQTSEEMLKVITEARQTSERLSESWAKGLANPIEPHTTHLSSPITVMIPEKTANNYDPFIEPLGRASVLQVPGSVSDVFLVHRVDSYVKEVEELPQESTNSNEKNVAHQVFDKMPLAVTSKEKQRKSPKAWKFKFKISFKKGKLMDDMFSFVEETAWPNRDPKETIWDCIKKEFKETMAACGKKTIDRLKLVDETSKPAVYDGPIQIRVWESGGSPLERVYEESSGDVKFHLKHKWRSRLLQTLSGLELFLLPAKLDLRDWQSKSYQGSHQSFDRKKSNKTFYLEDEHEQKEVTKFISSWNNRVWEPGGVLIEHDRWKELENCYKHGRLMRLMHWMSSMSWKEIKSREFDRLSACSCVDLKTWHCVKHDTQQTDFHVWHRWKNKAEKLEVSLVCSGKRWFFVVYAVSAYDRTVALKNESFLPPKIIREFESKIIAGMSRGQNTHHHHGKDYENEKLYLLGTEVKRVHMLLLLKEIVKASVEIMDCYKLTVFVNGLRYLMKRMDCVDNVILFTSSVKLLFPKNHKLLHYEADFCAQYNDLKQLNTEHQSSPGLDYFAYLIFIWNQALNCGCEAGHIGHISSGFSSVGDVHEFFTCSKLQNGDETYGKKLLDVNEVSLLDNDNKVDSTNWFYNKPIIREVFHLQRPPELIDLQGDPNFITKVLVQWKEHPPDQFFSSSYWQVLMLSSLRTRMFSTGEYCYRMLLSFWFNIGLLKFVGITLYAWYNYGLRTEYVRQCCHFWKISNH